MMVVRFETPLEILYLLLLLFKVHGEFSFVLQCYVVVLSTRQYFSNFYQVGRSISIRSAGQLIQS